MITVIAAADPLPEPQDNPLLRISGDIERTNVDDEAHFIRYDYRWVWQLNRLEIR